MNRTNLPGYRKRPWELTVLAVFFAFVPLLSWATRSLSFVMAGRPESFFQVLLSFYAPAGNGPIGLAHSILMTGLWGLFLVVGWGIFRVVRWGFVLCMVSAVANSLFSMVVYSVSRGEAGIQEGLSFNPFGVGVLLNLVFFVPVLIVLRQKIMAPFFNPRMKWWEQHPRIKALLKIEATVGGETKTYQSFDISASGMFLGTGEVPPVVLGEAFPASIHLEESKTVVEVVCKVVWISDGQGRSPIGCGVTFDYQKKAQRKTLPRYIQSKIREGHLLERT